MSNRRKFLKEFTLAGLATTSLPAFAKIKLDEADKNVEPGREQYFNMCGYAAPKMEVVRIGVVGLGMRGSEAVERLSYIDGVEIVALCDKYPDRVTKSQKTLERMQRPTAKEFSGEEGW